MPRYLTPVRLALLVLIRIYVKGHVSTTATVPVLTFLMKHILPPKHDGSATDSSAPAIRDFQEALSKSTTNFPGLSVWRLFLTHLWDFDSLNYLYDFFGQLSDLLTKPREQLIQERDESPVLQDEIRVANNSPFGVFLRRAQVEVTRMQPEDLVTLWKSFLLFREPTREAERKRRSTLEQYVLDSNVGPEGDLHTVLYGDLYGDLSSKRYIQAATSSHDVDLLIQFQLAKLQKKGERMPPEVRQKLTEMAGSVADLPVRVTYIEFLDAWKGGDYPLALDHLHRYFDYTMQNRDKIFYHYALLNLAILHADFGCWSEAISAINETISTAREHKDIPCLNYALSWLFHFRKANPEESEHFKKAGVAGTDKEGLTFLKAKARESNMWGLLATCYLTEARQFQSNGGSIASAFESLAKASHLNLTKNGPSSVGSELIAQSAMFSRIGQKHLAWSSIEVFLACYSNFSQGEDLLQFTCRSALLKAASGHYTEAFSILESSESSTTRIIKHQQVWISCNLLIKLRQAINKTNFTAADHFLTQLQANFLSQRR